MNDTQDVLELEVTDFGPIAKARLDLRPLTVFIGPSNTGKSYLAILIYALHKYFADQDSTYGWGSFWRYRSLWGDRETLSQEITNALLELTGQLLADKGKSEIALPNLIANEIRSTLDTQGTPLGNEVGRCFGIGELAGLIRKGKSSSTNISIRKRSLSGSTPNEYRLKVGKKEVELKTAVPEMRVRSDDGRLHYVAGRVIAEAAEERKGIFTRELLASLTEHVQASVIAPLNLPAFYLPADRTGVMHAHSTVVSAIIGSAPKAGLRPDTRTSMLSGVLADFLEQLIELDPPYQQNRPRRNLSRLSSEIEESILRGSVRVDRREATNYPSFTYQPPKWKKKLPLMNASSMVSELAPVVLYLRHIVEPNNVLMVEEPESHLHPAIQVEFTRQLAKLVHSGVKVIVTTHSEWVLEELANIVQRSKLPQARQKKVALHPDLVGVWLFNQKLRPKGSVVTKVPLDDSGLYPSGYEEVATALHNDWAEIANQVGEAG